MQAPQRRITEQMLYYWNRLRGERRWPAVGDIKAVVMPDVWEDVFIIKVNKAPESEKLSCTYAYQGKNVQSMLGNAMLSLKEGMDRKFENVFYSQDHLQDEQEFTNRNGIRIKYRQIILPLGPDNEHIDHLLGGMRHVAEERTRFF